SYVSSCVRNLAQKLYEFGLQKIDKDEVILRPSVLTHK
ncbi:hypothetical protein HMPREF9022_00248, partial [Erysipelotrichaceae bacterium 2_2_44A]